MWLVMDELSLLLGEEQGACEQHKNRKNLCDAPSCILFSSPLQFVFNNLLLVCGFVLFFFN